MTSLIRGIVHVTGESGSGKTTFCINNEKPGKICFIGDDVQDQSLSEQIHFGMYHNLVTECAGMRELEMHNYVLGIIDSIKPGQFDRIVFDTYTRFEDTYQPYVTANMPKFKTQWSPMGQIKGAQVWQVSFQYEAQILSKLSQLAPLVMLTSHIKEDKTNGVKTGKMISEGKRPLVTNTHMRIWLRRGIGPEPVGLLLKRPSLRVVKDDVIQTINPFPYKMTMTWENIEKYIKDPIGNRTPTAEETPDAYEIGVLSGVLTESQRQVLEWAAATGGKDLDPEPFVDPDIELKIRVKELKAQDKNIPTIARELDLSVTKVAELLSE
jgi:hypothetical protein